VKVLDSYTGRKEERDMKFKRVLASFLSAAMMLTCAPVPAWQAGIVNAEDVAEAGSTQEELQKKLDQAKADAKARLDRGTYTESSKTKLEQAIENADAIFADASAGNEAKQEAIDAIVSAAEDLQRQWTVKAWLDGVTVSADSAEDETGAACDGDVNTCYQSNYSGVNEVEYAVDEDGNAVYMTKNNNIYLKLSKATAITGVSYVPRIDSSGNLTQEGAITQASIYISKDNGATYTPEMENLVIEYAKADGTPWNYYKNGAIKIPFENPEENVTNVKI
jgi:Skp family chaperone for outer membrane proteins